MDYKTRRISGNIVSDDRPSYIFIAIPEQAVVSRAHFTLNFAQRSIHSRYMHLQTVAEQLINPIQALVRLCTLQAGMKTNQRQPDYLATDQQPLPYYDTPTTFYRPRGFICDGIIVFDAHWYCDNN